MNKLRLIRNIVSPLALVVVLLTFFCAAFAAGMSCDELFNEANQLYAGQQYEQALDAYKQIENGGYTSPALFFNMGNCSFRLGDIGLARGYYERALKAGMRNDEDLAFNLNFIRSMLNDPEQENPQVWYKALANIFAATTWLYIALASYVLVFVVAGAAFFKGTFSLTSKSLIATLVASCIICTAAFLYKKYNPENFAVISSKQADIMHTPSYTGNTFFTLHEGTKVRLLQTDGNWALINYAEDKRGWVDAANILAI